VIDDLLVRVENGHIGLVKGYRRMRCVRELIAEREWKHAGVPCKSEPKAASEREQLIVRLIEQVAHNQGKAYTILEEGRVLLRRLRHVCPQQLRWEGVTKTLRSRKGRQETVSTRSAVWQADKSFKRWKMAIAKPPEEYGGWENDPSNPEYQKRRTLSLKLFEKVIARASDNSA
jgi:hypothetical protein